MPEPFPENFGKRSPLKTEAVEKFAQNMGEDIVQSCMTEIKRGQYQMYALDQEQEAFAEQLTSEIIKTALSEAGLAQSIKASQKTDEEAEMESEEDNLLETQLKDMQTFDRPLFTQSGLPVVGSLDYPDTPPATPLLPELQRSRHSFARKLKGGLAKVFLPSPPPPTPKDKEENSDSTITNPQVELMEHLMHSLSINDFARDSLDVDPQLEAIVEAFAAAMSCDIVNFVCNVHRSEETPNDADLHLLAHRLAKTIITSSLDEANMLV